MIEQIDYDLQISEKQEQIFFPEVFPKFTIVPKGRRAGLTKGAALSFIEYGFNEDLPFFPRGPILGLWGDTVAANIDKYIDRYFLPELKQIPSGWRWKAQDRELTIGRLKIDFRSADRPENWEGFGYHIIFLNEAGIILEDDYLYNNAVLPMLVDFPNAKLLAAGVPKGKRHKKGPHKFYQLYQNALTDTDNKYRVVTMTGYDNPFISHEELDIIADSLDEETKKQEIGGEFVDLTEKKFLYAYSEAKHVTKEVYTPNPHLNIIISFDFNKDPMTCSIGQGLDVRTLKIFDCIKISNGSTPELCDKIIAKYPQFMYKMDVTGDSTGNNRTPMLEGDINHYVIIRQKLKLKDHNLKVQTKNKELSASRILCNSILQNAEVAITSNCQDVINDLGASVDGYGELIKDKANPLHFFDNFRYMLEAYYPDFIEKPHLYKKKSA